MSQLDDYFKIAVEVTADDGRTQRVVHLLKWVELSGMSIQELADRYLQTMAAAALQPFKRDTP